MKDQKSKADYKREQSEFDQGFILAIKELQQRGFCKNISAIEQYLKLPPRTLHWVINGVRPTPMLHRSKIQKLLVETYDINPRIFSNSIVGVFKHNPPHLEDVEEPFIYKKQTNQLSMGDMYELERLRSENTLLKDETNILKDHIKMLEKQLNRMEKMLDRMEKTDTKPDKEE